MAEFKEELEKVLQNGEKVAEGEDEETGGGGKVVPGRGKGKDGEVAAEGAEDRGTWSGKLDFIMSALSFAVGMGNIWRFPYLCYRNGGGAFLIPYLIMVVFAGLPLMYMEMALGQYGSLGVVSIWRACPLFQGIGWTMFCISLFSCIYYNMLIAYSFFYTFASFARQVPWEECGNDWNTEGCGDVSNMRDINNCTKHEGLWYNSTCVTLGQYGEELYNETARILQDADLPSRKSASDEYFHRYMLDISEGIDDLGGVRWQLALCLLLCWILVILGLSTGVKSLGKATYVTSIFPYLILVILFVRGLTLEGSAEGILYYITPKFERLLNAKVWGDAAVQVFFSMSCCWGGLITLASYNKFNNNVFRDALVVAVGDCLTSIFGGFVIFAIIGYMANELHVPIEKVATQGAGLAFIVYPQVVTRLPISPLWAVLFMLMLVNLGIGTQFTLVTTSHTTLLDVFPSTLRKGRRPLFLLLGLCLGCYLLGLVICTRGGMYVLQLMDSYCPSYALLLVGLFECIALQWLYGDQRFMKDLEAMLGYKPRRVWTIIWKFVTPAIIVGILLFTFIDYKRSSYGDYTFPVWADAIGFLIVLVEVGFIPGVAIYKLLTEYKEESFLRRLRILSQPSLEWGPAMEKRRDTNAEAEWRIPLTKKKHEEMEEDDDNGQRTPAETNMSRDTTQSFA